MKVTSHLKIPTLLAASLSCLMLAGCGVDSKPSIPSAHSTDGGKTDGGKTDGGKTDGGKTTNPDVLVSLLNANVNTPIYENGSDKEECYGEGGFGKNEGQKCGALTYAISADMNSVLKVPEDKPVMVTYTLSSPQGNIADILQDPTQKTGTIKLHRGYIQSNLVIPLKTDNKNTGNWQVTLTLSNPENGAMFRDNAKTFSSFPREVIDPQASGATTPTPTAKPTTAVQAANINDTGVTFTGNNPKGNELTTNCTNTMTAKQDCNVGRDAMYNNNSNGWAGFDFTKLDKDGKDLDANATDWSCVRDNVTGLVWERKTYAEKEADRDYRDVAWNYGYYDSKQKLGQASYLNNSGYSGGICDEEDKSTNCTTEAYITKVNSKELCGISNWRLPNRNELFGVLNLSGKDDAEVVHSDWLLSSNQKIPNYFWTSSVAAGSTRASAYTYDYIWLVSSKGNLNNGKLQGYFGPEENSILLVSGVQ